MSTLLVKKSTKRNCINKNKKMTRNFFPISAYLFYLIFKMALTSTI